MGPAWIGACTTLAYYVVFSLGGLALWAIGYEQLRWDNSQISIDVVQAAAVGYMVAAAYYGRREAARDLIALRQALSCSSAEFDALLARLRRTDSWVHIGSVGGMIAGIWVVSLDAYWAEEVPLGSPMMNLHMAKMALSSSLIGSYFESDSAPRITLIALT